ncbi:MAG: thioredoxin domain-containing protein [Candidatus Tectomicrobia bacterium]|uniref:Thioredoxin domain-containing protein n=1 Tax=Tectimicrobiota bacterium TaxID=2528274 RepID=A0A937W3D9_UNCTE|nr:thioredoxin domain-containing protein [Candidatus Tectomicrobia bacterium]
MFRFSPRPNRAHLVQWRPWGHEAFHEAQQQDKPVVLWLTAFWCGYCQRMDDTTLSHDDVIALLNAFFVPIRVEESQRPDIDLRYSQNGWPTIAFLTPGGDDIVRVNYLDPEPFISLLVRLVDAYQRDKTTILETAARHRAEAQQRLSQETPAPLGAPIVAEIAGMLEGLADQAHGGYGTQNKLLHTEANDFLLYLYGVSGERFYLDHVTFTLEQMRESRIFDQQDGGFFRYSSRPDWREPHPEKLLDDQAGLLRNYLYAYVLSERAIYRDTAAGLVDYLNTTLSDTAQPCFWGCQDYVRPPLPPLSEPRSGPLPLLSLLDQYVYCDANARTASAYLDAWWILGRDDCRERAIAILEHLWETFRAPSGSMYHYRDEALHAPGLLLDTTMVGLAMLDAYALLQQPSYLDRARQLSTVILQRHNNPAGGFFDISELGPASVQTPITVLTQNARVATFFVRLADLSGETDYRKLAYWALRSFPNAHRQHEAFAAGFGHALALLLTLPVYCTITGTPGDPRLLALARGALTRLRHGNVVLRLQSSQTPQPASLTLQAGTYQTEAIIDPATLTTELLSTLQAAWV